MTIAFLYFVLWLFVGERLISEVEGSNPSPATSSAGQRPLPVTEEAINLPCANGQGSARTSPCCASAIRGLTPEGCQLLLRM
jgi:hypothetical protein